MYKHAFSVTGDEFSLENVDNGYSLVNIEFMSDRCDGIQKQKIDLPVTCDKNVFCMMVMYMIMVLLVVMIKLFKMYIY